MAVLRPLARARLRTVLNPTAAVWAGVTLVTTGFAALFFTWARVAGLLDVAEQLPYVVAAGITGLALIVVGITVADVATRKHDRHERTYQMAQLTRTRAELHKAYLLGDDETGAQ